MTVFVRKPCLVKNKVTTTTMLLVAVLVVAAAATAHANAATATLPTLTYPYPALTGGENGSAGSLAADAPDLKHSRSSNPPPLLQARSVALRRRSRPIRWCDIAGRPSW